MHIQACTCKCNLVVYRHLIIVVILAAVQQAELVHTGAGNPTLVLRPNQQPQVLKQGGLAGADAAAQC
jgi:hypothetical protein